MLWTIAMTLASLVLAAIIVSGFIPSAFIARMSVVEFRLFMVGIGGVIGICLGIVVIGAMVKLSGINL